jgi:hypothetical protein
MTKANEISTDAAVASAPIDVFIPPYYRHTDARYAYPTSIVTVDYGATAETLSTLNEPPGTVEVTIVPYVRRHKTEEAVGSGDDVFTATNTTWKPEELKANAKQGLMEMLLGGAAAEETMLSGVGRTLPAPSVTEEVQTRLRGVRCDATHITTPLLLVTLVRTILAKRTDPARSLVDCVTAIDLSYTQLGKVTCDGPPLHFDDEGNELPPPPNAVVTRFYPDESLRRAESPEEVRKRVAERSLALTYVAPLLFTHGARLYCIRELICTHCGLTDEDAHALALILKTGSGSSGRGGEGSKKKRGPAAFFSTERKGDGVMCCTLETLDISYNAITDAGMAEIRRAIRRNRRITTIVVVGNDLRNRQKVMDGIERQLQRNREGKTSASWINPRHWHKLWKKS